VLQNFDDQAKYSLLGYANGLRQVLLDMMPYNTIVAVTIPTYFNGYILTPY
jgi:hypothetical protein